MFKRIFLVVLDSCGVGSSSDAAYFDDEGANTILHTIEGRNYNLDVLEKLGLTSLVLEEKNDVRSLYMKAKPMNKAKDSLNGHYELMGALTEIPYKTYPDGFPLELISEIKRVSNRDVIGNIAASGTEIIEELGDTVDKVILYRVYFERGKMSRIAHDLGYSKRWVETRCNEAIKKLENSSQFSQYFA